MDFSWKTIRKNVSVYYTLQKNCRYSISTVTLFVTFVVTFTVTFLVTEIMLLNLPLPLLSLPHAKKYSVAAVTIFGHAWQGSLQCFLSVTDIVTKMWRITLTVTKMWRITLTVTFNVTLTITLNQSMGLIY